MNHLLNYWKSSYYTEPILILTQLVFLLISSRNPIPKKQFRGIIIYTILFLIYYLATIFLSLFLTPKLYSNINSYFQVYFDYLITISEFFVFLYFLFKTVNNIVAKRAILSMVVTGLAVFFFWGMTDFLSSHTILYQTLMRIYPIEDSVVLLASGFYFYEIFNTPPFKSLINSPSFWIIVGFVSFMIITFPVTLIDSYLIKWKPIFYSNTFAIVYISYIFMYVMFIRAYLCKPVATI